MKQLSPLPSVQPQPPLQPQSQLRPLHPPPSSEERKEWCTQAIDRLEQGTLPPPPGWAMPILDFGFLALLIEQFRPNEIIFHHFGQLVGECSGVLQPLPSPFESELEYQLFLMLLRVTHQLSCSYLHPVCGRVTTLRGHRVRLTLIHASLASTTSHKLFLRIFYDHHTLADFLTSPDQEGPLRSLLAQRKNLLIAGATNSGKTTLLRTLLRELPKAEQQHLVIIEDLLEIGQIQDNATHLLADPLLEQRSLVKLCEYSLRLRPDRIILGEIRGAEVVPLVLSLNTGHFGLMATVHANSPQEVLWRLATLIETYAPQLRGAHRMAELKRSIDAVLYLANKKVVAIQTLSGAGAGL